MALLVELAGITAHRAHQAVASCTGSLPAQSLYCHQPIRTVDSLKSIGATNTASLLAAANAEFQNSAPPTDRTLRQDLLEEMRDRVSFSPLEQEFFQDQERLMSRLANHLRTHFAQQAGLS